MNEQEDQRINKFPFSKSIVGKVGFIMALMTLSAMFISISTYIMHDAASSDTTNTNRIEIPSALLSVSMLRYVGEMNRSLLSYALGERTALNTYYLNKNKFEISLIELKKIQYIHINNLDRIGATYGSLIKQIKLRVINQYDPKWEDWALTEKRLITDVMYPELNRAIHGLEILDSDGSHFKPKERNNLIWLLHQSNDYMRSSLFFYLNGELFDIGKFTENKKSFFTYLARLKKNSNSESERSKINDIEELNIAFVRRLENVFNRYNATQKQQAITALKEINTQEYKALETELTSFSRETSFRAANSMANLQKVLETNQLSFFALFVLMTLVSIAITVYIYKKVTQPIARLADTMLKLSDGNTEIPILYKERPDEVGQISHALSSFRDHIISRNQAREQLLYQKERAESASKTKAHFLAAMSHEIRTPMNGVIGMIDILRRSNLDVTQLSVVNTVRESALSLLSIINDILDFSRIEAGKMHIDKVPLSIRHIAEQVMDNLISEANDKNVTLILFVDPAVPTSLLGDPTKIRQILFNLIGNGIKFSGGQPHQGEVHASITCDTLNIRELKNDHVLLSFEIKDNGIGISSDKLESIFQPFTQAEYSTTRRYGGSGLGLTISKHIISLVGGNIRAQSEEGIGSSFFVNISFATCETINVPDESNMLLLSKAANSLNGVICINTLENGALKSCIDSYLNHMNIESRSITLDMLHNESFDRDNITDNHNKFVIICRDYAQTKQLNSTFSSYEDSVVRYLELSMSLPVIRYNSNDVFTIYSSPMKLSVLLSGLRICVGLESPHYKEFDTHGKEVFIDQTSENFGTILVAEDNSTNQIVIKKQLTYLGYKVVIASDGQEALRAYRNQSFILVLTDCHMPNMDGYELTRAIRSIQKKRGEFVPIIALTANALLGEAERCISTGMNDFIAKPVEIDVIQKILNKWKKHSRPLIIDHPIDDLDKKNSKTVNVASTTSVSSDLKTQHTDNKTCTELDPFILEKLFWGDKATYSDVLGEFEKHCIPELQKLANALPPYNYTTIKNSAHKLKTSSRSIGARSLSDVCQSLETAAIEKSLEITSLLDDLRIQINGSINVVRTKRISLEVELNKGEMNTPYV